MNRRVLRVALLLFGSGLTALIYQVAWMRELRLVFGFSTAASAAVLAIFMGGLGVGGWLLGQRADASDRPLAFYGQLELAARLDDHRYAATVQQMEPNVPWRTPILQRRAHAYTAMGHPLAALARKELAEFLENEPPPFTPGVVPPAAAAAPREGS
jgi:hypothetical protein